MRNRRTNSGRADQLGGMGDRHGFARVLAENPEFAVQILKELERANGIDGTDTPRMNAAPKDMGISIETIAVSRVSRLSPREGPVRYCWVQRRRSSSSAGSGGKAGGAGAPIRSSASASGSSCTRTSGSNSSGGGRSGGRGVGSGSDRSGSAGVNVQSLSQRSGVRGCSRRTRGSAVIGGSRNGSRSVQLACPGDLARVVAVGDGVGAQIILARFNALLHHPVQAGEGTIH